MIEPLKKAADAGIPVLTVDTFIGDGHYQTGSGNADFPLSYIASDNILGGQIAARALAKVIGDKGKVYVSNVRPGISTTDQREQGFKEEMKKHSGITVLETQYNDDDANKAASQFQSVYARNSDLTGVFGANLFSAMGAANGAKQGGVVGKVKVEAFDAPTSIVGDIKAGNVDIAIAQHPAEIGYFGVVAAYAHLTGQSVPTLIGTGFTVIDKNNVDDPNVKRYIYSDYPEVRRRNLAASSDAPARFLFVSHVSYETSSDHHGSNGQRYKPDSLAGFSSGVSSVAFPGNPFNHFRDLGPYRVRQLVFPESV